MIYTKQGRTILERAILSSFALENTFSDSLTLLEERSFSTAHRRAYSAMKRAHDSGATVNLVTICHNYDGNALEIVNLLTHGYTRTATKELMLILLQYNLWDAIQAIGKQEQQSADNIVVTYATEMLGLLEELSDPLELLPYVDLLKQAIPNSSLYEKMNQLRTRFEKRCQKIQKLESSSLS
jgi:hypothetical protein